MFLVKGLPPAPRRTHHLHVTELAGELWQQLLFRDYLRAHPHEAAEYAMLKRDLARRFPHDREAYTDAKEPYIQAVMAKARAPLMQTPGRNRFDR